MIDNKIEIKDIPILMQYAIEKFKKSDTHDMLSRFHTWLKTEEGKQFAKQMGEIPKLPDDSWKNRF
jgi:hypothetical protein